MTRWNSRERSSGPAAPAAAKGQAVGAVPEGAVEAPADLAGAGREGLLAAVLALAARGEVEVPEARAAVGAAWVVR